MGGKGGFGSLLKSQRGGKKTKHFDACRDIQGRRLRHAKVIDRLKEWLQKKREDDEIVRQLTDGLDKMSIDNAAEISPEFVIEMRARARSLEALVREGIHFEKIKFLEYQKKRALESSSKEFKYKKLFFEEDLDISDAESDFEDEQICPVSNNAPISDSIKIIPACIAPPLSPKPEESDVALAAAECTSEADSEDSNSDIDEFFNEAGDINDNAIAIFFKSDGKGDNVNEGLITRFIAATARTTAIDAENILKARKLNQKE